MTIKTTQLQMDAHRIATRRLMSYLAAHLTPEQLAQLSAWLDDRRVLHDGSEDPGAVITEGLELELAVASAFGTMADALEGETRADPAVSGT